MVGAPRRPPQIESRSPAAGKRLGAVTARAPRDVAVAVDRPRRSSAWAILRVKDRARYMARAAQAVIDELDELTELLSPSRAGRAPRSRPMELFPGGRDAAVAGRARPRILAGSSMPFLPRHPLKRARWSYEPLGVIGVLGPPTEPFATPLGDVAVALMAGAIRGLRRWRSWTTYC